MEGSTVLQLSITSASSALESYINSKKCLRFGLMVLFMRNGSFILLNDFYIIA